MNVQHLCVNDGDLRAQDALQKRIESLSEENARDRDAIDKLLAASPVNDKMERFEAARGAFQESWQEAVKRSRQETVDGVEERDGSRDLYAAEVAPAADTLTETGDVHQEAISGRLGGLLQVRIVESARESAQEAARAGRSRA